MWVYTSMSGRTFRDKGAFLSLNPRQEHALGYAADDFRSHLRCFHCYSDDSDLAMEEALLLFSMLIARALSSMRLFFGSA